MARVRQHGTKPELAVRKALTGRGFRYRLNVRHLPGSPDLANVGRKFVIFVHGCFWHRHPGCRLATTPGTNREFWARKFAANQLRDRRNSDTLERLGFNVCVIWECETRDAATLDERLRHCLPEWDRSVGRGSGARARTSGPGRAQGSSG
jgi:DNA mismatch endonuclease (patch repair protein)